MAIEERAKATAKNIEGKVQAAVGELTGDRQQQVEGKAKQAEASLEHSVENMKNQAKDALDNLKKKID